MQIDRFSIKGKIQALSFTMKKMSDKEVKEAFALFSPGRVIDILADLNAIETALCMNDHSDPSEYDA